MALKLLYTLDHEADRQVVHPRDTGTPHMQTYNYHKRADSRVKESVFIRVMRAFWGIIMADWTTKQTAKSSNGNALPHTWLVLRIYRYLEYAPTRIQCLHIT